MDCPIVKQVTEAFLAFDLEHKESIDVREVGTIIRSLGIDYLLQFKNFFNISLSVN